MNLIEELRWRNLLQDVSDPDGILKLGKEHSFYVGYDPTAASLQAGNLIPIIASIHLAKNGLKAIQLFGGATGSIGDPSGRSSERQLLDRETIIKNATNHQRIVRAIFERSGVTAEFVDNYEWTENLSTLDFLRDVGKHFTVNYMIAKDVVKRRLEGDGISFTEFSYMLLQAYDFLHLYQTKNCRLQIGGSDQWGNITAGLELIRRKIQGEAYALSIPLLLDSSGKKFGKTGSGTIWLDPAHTSPFKFHQFWLNADDQDAVRYLKVFTFLSPARISELEAATKSAPEKREAQRALADEVCTLVHGEGATKDAKRSAEVLFGGSLEGVSDEALLDIFSDVPSSSITREELSSLSVIDVLIRAQLSKSKGEARRLIESGGAYVNNTRVEGIERMLRDGASQKASVVILRSGKKNYHLLKVQ